MEKRYNNYHKHTHYSNIRTQDVIVKPIDYFRRMVELGHTHYFTTEHGYQGNILGTMTELESFNKELPNEKKIKLVVGVEAYFTMEYEEKDRTSFHLVFVALNNKGVEEINLLISESNTEGFYYKNRVDTKMIKKYLNPENVIVTSACVAGICAIWNPLAESLVRWFKEYFGKNFYLEIQAHSSEKQIEHNKKIKEYADKYSVEIIHANDSHYIYPEQSELRNLYLKSKGMNYYEDGDDFILDYPTREAILKRYEKQGVFSKEEAEKAINRTLIFDQCEEITLYNKEIKIPSLSSQPNDDLKKIINKEWNNVKHLKPKRLYPKYMEEIRYEMGIIEETKMADYFLLDYELCKLAEKKYNALLTKTGRGSGGSFYINTLLGLAGLDRIQAPVTLYPTRFMSATRILQSRSLPDIDINCSDQELLIKASEDLLGKEKCGWLVSYGYIKESRALRLWLKALDYPAGIINDIALNIDVYREHPQWKKHIEDSKAFYGVIESISPSPCSMVLSTEDVPSHFGLIKIKDKICCNLDKYCCDGYKYLKND